MRGPTIVAVLLAVALLAAPFAALAQTGTVVVPAPAPGSASPGTTVVTPGASGTTVVAPPGSTVTIQPPPPPVVAVSPWCAGTFSTMGGTNFGSCPGFVPK